jgi:hypothetical protein
VLFPERNFTDCHQFVWVIGSRQQAERRWLDLEAAGLHVTWSGRRFTRASPASASTPPRRPAVAWESSRCTSWLACSARSAAGRTDHAAEAVARLSSIERYLADRDISPPTTPTPQRQNVRIP